MSHFSLIQEILIFLKYDKLCCMVYFLIIISCLLEFCIYLYSEYDHRNIPSVILI